jgi:hypothetical protein
MHDSLALATGLVPTVLLMLTSALHAAALAPPPAGPTAAGRYPDGTMRLIYAVESPEVWIEGFGRGQLVNGRASMPIAADYAPIVDLSQAYYVFLTAHGESRGLYVVNQSPTGFEVREQRGGTSTPRFSYRVVAQRKDHPGGRLRTIERPVLL